MLMILLSAISACLVKSNMAERNASALSASSTLYFSETGHSVQEPFASYYLQHNGIQRLGYPITEALDHEGWRVQYFQFGRLELHPENQPDYVVTVGWLGQQSHRTTPPLKQALTGATEFFPESGHSLNGDFLNYFNNNGNTVQFGYPVSEAFVLNGYLQQDFQSARFIWLPFPFGAGRVELEPLGENYFLGSDLPVTALNPILPPPQAETFSVSNTICVLPDNATASLTIEPTPNSDYVRLKVQVLLEGKPVANFVPLLIWNEQQQLLPPTRASGQSHILINVAGLNKANFFLYAPDSPTILATASF